MLRRFSSLILALMLGGSVLAGAARLHKEHVCEMAGMEMMPGMDTIPCHAIGAICLGMAYALGAMLMWLGYSQFIAFSMILLGVWRFFSGAGLGGLWIAFLE